MILKLKPIDYLALYNSKSKLFKIKILIGFEDVQGYISKITQIDLFFEIKLSIKEEINTTNDQNNLTLAFNFKEVEYIYLGTCTS